MNLLSIALMIAAHRDVDQRTQRAEYLHLVQLRAQHREVERVQPVSHLSPEEERAIRAAAAARLVVRR